MYTPSRPLFCHFLLLLTATLWCGISTPVHSETIATWPGGEPLRRSDFARWAVKIDLSNPQPAAALREALAAGTLPEDWSPRLKSQKFSKSKNIVQEISTNELDSEIERWVINNRQVAYIPETKSYIWINPGSEGSPGYLDFSKCDFPELSWVEKSKFVGVSGDVLVFADPAKALRAEVKADTRLPVKFTADGTTYTYQFENPDTTMLTPPKPFLDSFAEQEKSWARFQSRPRKP